MEDFDEESNLGMAWVLLGTPYEPFYKISNSKLSLKCLKENMTLVIKPLSFNPEICTDRIISFVGKRQIYIDFSVFTKMSFNPQEGEAAGLAIMQAMHHHIRVERTCENGEHLLKLIISTTDYDRPPYIPGFKYEHKEEIIACVPCDYNEFILGFNANHESYEFVYGTDLEHMKCLVENVDCGRINPEYVGCMAGTIIGMFATANGKDSDNVAEFDWFEIKETK